MLWWHIMVPIRIILSEAKRVQSRAFRHRSRLASVIHITIRKTLFILQRRVLAIEYFFHVFHYFHNWLFFRKYRLAFQPQDARGRGGRSSGLNGCYRSVPPSNERFRTKGRPKRRKRNVPANRGATEAKARVLEGPQSRCLRCKPNAEGKRWTTDFTDFTDFADERRWGYCLLPLASVPDEFLQRIRVHPEWEKYWGTLKRELRQVPAKQGSAAPSSFWLI